MIMIQPVQILTELSQHRLNTCILLNDDTVSKFDMLKLTLFDMGGGGMMMAPQNVFDHCAQTLRRKKLKLGDF